MLDVVLSPKSQAYPKIDPSLSVPEPLNDTLKGASPLWKFPEAIATGGWFGAGDGIRGGNVNTVIDIVAFPVAPSLSVTVSVAVYVPSELYVFIGFLSPDVVPSPKSHAYATIDPSLSVPEPLNDTLSGDSPVKGVADADATGGWFGA